MTTMTHHPRGHRWWHTVFPILRPKPQSDAVAVEAQAREARLRTERRASELQRAMAKTLIEVDKRAHDGLSG